MLGFCSFRLRRKWRDDVLPRFRNACRGDWRGIEAGGIQPYKGVEE